MSWSWAHPFWSGYVLYSAGNPAVRHARRDVHPGPRSLPACQYRGVAFDCCRPRCNESSQSRLVYGTLGRLPDHCGSGSRIVGEPTGTVCLLTVTNDDFLVVSGYRLPNSCASSCRTFSSSVSVLCLRTLICTDLGHHYRQYCSPEPA